MVVLIGRVVLLAGFFVWLVGVPLLAFVLQWFDQVIENSRHERTNPEGIEHEWYRCGCQIVFGYGFRKCDRPDWRCWRHLYWKRRS